MAIFVEQNRERFAPIALTAEEPVAELIVDGELGQPFIGQIGLDNHPLGLICGVAVKVELIVGRIHDQAEFGFSLWQWLGVIQKILRHNAFDGQVEDFGELEIAIVVARYGHDCAGAVTGEDVISDPDRDWLECDRVHGISAGEDTGFFASGVLTLHVTLGGHFGLIGFDG